MKDIRDRLFVSLKGREFRAELRAEESGVVAGIESLREKASRVGVRVDMKVENGTTVRENDLICLIEGNPKEIALAEELLIGALAKPSGIATAARKAVERMGGRLKIVSGAWKKQPLEIKEIVRNAVEIGGARVRMTSRPFIYLDKNYVRMFGGIRESLAAATKLSGHKIVIQVRGETDNVGREAVKAAKNGAKVVMVDTGHVEDVKEVSKTLEEAGLRGDIEVAFAGGVDLDDLSAVERVGVDAVDMGREIVDAPILDFTLDVINND